MDDRDAALRAGLLRSLRRYRKQELIAMVGRGLSVQDERDRLAAANAALTREVEGLRDALAAIGEDPRHAVTIARAALGETDDLPSPKQRRINVLEFALRQIAGHLADRRTHPDVRLGSIANELDHAGFTVAYSDVAR